MTKTTALIAASGLVATIAYLSPVGQTEASWNASQAARYLDARMDLWWTNAKVLKTGGAEARCISCHTAVPYALARPALRRTLGESSPTTNEARLVATVLSRVQSFENKQPFYDQSEDKKLESAGVESVLNALVLATHDAELKQKAPGAPTREAIAQLWRAQRADGAWNWLNFGLEPYEAPDAVFHGATLAALAIGTAPGLTATADPATQTGLDRLTSYLRTNMPRQRLFNRAWALLAAARLEGVLTDGEREAIVVELKSRQRPDGGWSLTDMGTWRWNQQAAPFNGPGETDKALLSAADGYATGLAVYALRQAGVKPDERVIILGQDWLRSHQAPETSDASWAPWRAHSLNFDREHGGPKGEPWRRMFMSDLATAFASLALTE